MKTLQKKWLRKSITLFLLSGMCCIGTSAYAEGSPVITGDPAKDIYYVENGVLQSDGTYKFTEDSTVKAEEKDITEEKFPAITIAKAQVIAPVLGTEKDIKMDAEGKTLRLESVYVSDKPFSNDDDEINVIGIYAAKNMDIKAKDLVIKARSAAGRGYETVGIFMPEEAAVNIDGNVSIQSFQEKNWRGKAYGIYMGNGGNKLTINGDLAMVGEGTEGEALIRCAGKKNAVWQEG